MSEIVLTVAVAVISSGLLLGLVQLWVGRAGRHANTDSIVVGTAHDVVEVLRDELDSLRGRVEAIEEDLNKAHAENRRLRRALVEIRDVLLDKFDFRLDFTEFGLPPDLMHKYPH